MRELTTRTLAIALACLTVVALSACNTEPQTCDKVAADYQALYTPVDGSCGPIANPYMVRFDGGLKGVNTIMQNLANVLLTTDIVMKGCTVHMTQKVSNREGGILLSEIDGQSISLKDQDRLTGRVSIAQYDMATGALLCNGNYDAAFTRNSVTDMSAAGAVGAAGK